MPRTDNSLLQTKVRLRIDHMPSGAVNVLDCYGGYGVVWSEVRKCTGRADITRTGIDREPRPGCLRGDNRKWLLGMDLSRYNVIDLDAYGIPFDQLRILFERGYRGIVFYTFIQVGFRQVPFGLCDACGITQAMCAACPTLFGQLGWELWLQFLAANRVDETTFCEIKGSGSEKHYGVFVVA